MMTKMMSSVSPGIPSPPPSKQSSSSQKTIRSIPGSYGLPLLGPLSDRLDYFWLQGPDKFFKTRSEKHKSTIFRTNVPPSFPFVENVNPNVIAVLDCKSFAHLFDMELIEKKNVLVGDFMPSVDFTGGTRVCAFLDTTEKDHSKIKNFIMDILKRSSKVWEKELLANLETMWDTIESDLSKQNTTTTSYGEPLRQFLFKFLSKTMLGADPARSPKIAESGHAMLDIWLGLILFPTIAAGPSHPLIEIFLHSFEKPFSLVSSGYKELYEFVEKEGKDVVARGENEFGLGHEETIHNLLFTFGFNAYGGFGILLTTVLAIIGGNPGLQEALKNDVRKKTTCDPMSLSFDSVKDMELVQSTVYEALRFRPPVSSQYGRARKDFVISSYDSDFQIKKGELLCGYQPQVMRDPNVFKEPDSFLHDRFMGPKGKELLNYLFWSNGPQTGFSGESNKQCAGKDVVPLSACLVIAYLFTRYDSITCDSSSITAVKKAN